MKCPFCSHNDDRVVDSREGKGGRIIRRRRECNKCKRRFTSYERIEEVPYMVVKKDGSRETFERRKILGGLMKACEKRPVPVRSLEQIVDEVEQMLQEGTDREFPTQKIGTHVMNRLRRLDKVAYVRFASVYRQFEDVNEFMSELEGLLDQRK
ncbi:MAG: transcriptional regulator NrdR [Acidobacteriota bacterium]